MIHTEPLAWLAALCSLSSDEGWTGSSATKVMDPRERETGWGIPEGAFPTHSVPHLRFGSPKTPAKSVLASPVLEQGNFPRKQPGSSSNKLSQSSPSHAWSRAQVKFLDSPGLPRAPT